MKWNFAFDKPIKQLLLFLLLMLFSAAVVFGLSSIVAIVFYGKDSLVFDISNSDSLYVLKIFQAATHIGLFLIPALIYAYISGIGFGNYLNVNKLPNKKLLLLSFVLFVVAIPAISYLAELNLKLSLPQWMNSIELWMQDSEKRAKIITDAFLKTNQFSDFLVNIFLIALLPAVSEEFVFRGFLMRNFARFIKNIHVNVFLVAIIFSAMHLQFYGFLPRFVIGVVLGYLLVWSGSIWLPIIFHFINNAITVTIYYLFQINLISQNPDEMQQFSSFFLLIPFFVILFYFNSQRIPNFSLNITKPSPLNENLEN